MFFYINKYKYKLNKNKNSLDLIEYLYKYKYKLSIEDCDDAINEFLLKPMWHKSHSNFINDIYKFFIIFRPYVSRHHINIKYIDESILFDIFNEMDVSKIIYINQLFLLNKICKKITDDYLLDNDNLLKDFYRIINYEYDIFTARQICKKICDAIKMPNKFKIEDLMEIPT